MDQRIVKTSCPRDCFSGCTMKVHVENGRIAGFQGDEANKGAGGSLCAKGMAYIEYVYSPNRVGYPMVRVGNREEGKFKRISWQDAIQTIGEKLRDIKENYGPLSLLYYSSGGCQGLLSEYYKGFFSQYGGFTTTSGNLCYSAGIEATRLTYGEVIQNAPWDLENAGLIILWGKNPAFTNVQEMRFINNALSKGSKLITIDPIQNASSGKSHLHISPKPGTDGVLALCIMNLLVKRNSVDYDFIEKYTYGFEALKKHVEKVTVSKAAKVCGINENDIYSMLELIESSRPMTLVCGFGLQRYKNGGQTVRAISMIPALRGDVSAPGGGFKFANKRWKHLKWPFVSSSDYTVRSEYPSSRFGKALEGHKDPAIKMCWIERANPLTMNPDIKGLKRALGNMDCIVVVDQFMTDTAKFADIILPAQSFFEYDDIFSGYWTPYLSLCRKVIEPVGESKNESQIYRMLGQYMGYDMELLPEYTLDAIDDILRASGAGVGVEDLIEGPYMYEQDIAFKDRIFKTPSGKIELYSQSMMELWGQNPLPEYNIHDDSLYPLRFLSTHPRERIHSQFGDIEKLKGKDDRVLVYINPQDAKVREISDGEKVEVFNDRGIIHAYAFVTDKIKEGVVNIYEGLPESSGAGVNVLTAQETSDIAYGAVYYDCFVDIAKAL